MRRWKIESRVPSVEEVPRSNSDVTEGRKALAVSYSGGRIET